KSQTCRASAWQSHYQQLPLLLCSLPPLRLRTILRLEPFRSFATRQHISPRWIILRDDSQTHEGGMKFVAKRGLSGRRWIQIHFDPVHAVIYRAANSGCGIVIVRRRIRPRALGGVAVLTCAGCLGSVGLPFFITNAAVFFHGPLFATAGRDRRDRNRLPLAKEHGGNQTQIRGLPELRPV